MLDEEVKQPPSETEPEDEQNPYADLQAISARLDKALTVDRFERSLFEREWFRNVLFYAGQHWIIYTNGRWRPRVLPAWFPRAQTNKINELSNTVATTLLQGRPPIRYQPSTDDDADYRLAEFGEQVRQVIYSEAKIDDKEQELAMWLTLTGNVFLLPHYDMDEKYGMRELPGEFQCSDCGEDVSIPPPMPGMPPAPPTCQACGSENLTPAMAPVGSLQADVCSPFEIRLDHRHRNFEDQERFVRMRRYDLDYAKDKWKTDANGMPISDLMSADGGNDLSQFYLDVLSHVTGTFGASGGIMGGGPTGGKSPKVTAYEFYELPSDKFPEGLRAVRIGSAGSMVVEAGPLPDSYVVGPQAKKKFLPLVHYGFDLVPGRFWKKTRIDDLIPLQVFRNIVEANLRLTAQRMGNPIWLIPKGSGVDILTGESGQMVQYNPVNFGGTNFAKPERDPAEMSNVGPSLMLLKMIDDAMERLAGTFFLQGGETPPGVTAASALAYLGERAQKSMTPLMREYAKGWKRFEEMALEIARANWDDERLHTIAGQNHQWETQRFRKADLLGQVNMTIDYEALFPKSNATQRATLQTLLQVPGIVNPLDPEQNYKILEIFGMTQLKPSNDIDVREAVKEWDEFLSDDKPPMLLPIAQNDTVHLQYHTNAMKTDEFKTLPQDKQDIWTAHVQATVADLMMRRAAFGAAGINIDDPSTQEISTGEAQIAAQQAAALGLTPPPPPGSEGAAPGGKGKGGKGGPPEPQQPPDIADPTSGNVNAPPEPGQ
jgi:hypothetical protein